MREICLLSFLVWICMLQKCQKVCLRLLIFYKNSAIYFNEHIPDEDREEFAVHECIHHIQEVKDKKIT